MGIRWRGKDCRLFEFGFFDVLPDGGDFHEFFVGVLSCRTGHKRIRRDPLMNLPDSRGEPLKTPPYWFPRLRALLQFLGIVH